MLIRDRCKTFLNMLQTNARLRQGSPVDDLMAFVVAETGRAAEIHFENGLPLCIYFGTEEDREEFLVAFHEVHPNAVMKKMP